MTMRASDFIGLRFYDIEGLNVASWSPGDASKGDPVTEVHVLIKIVGIPNPLIMRLKSQEAAEEIIAALVDHTEEVWPK